MKISLRLFFHSDVVLKCIVKLTCKSGTLFVISSSESESSEASEACDACDGLADDLDANFSSNS